MKAFINGHQVSGHPKEIAELLKVLEPKQRVREHSVSPVAPRSNALTLPVKNVLTPGVQDTVTESQQLRQQLEQDPDFNPYPGVLLGQQDAPRQQSQPQRRLYGAEQDTGVQYET